jgi:TetR/AcrR family transcriptional repressor of nem operon
MGQSAALRARGVAGVGVADLMRQAGLTHGGFYSHFSSKDALVAEAIDAAGEQSVRNLRKVVQRAGEQSALKAIVESYLSTAHRDAPEARLRVRRARRRARRASRPQRAER